MRQKFSLFTTTATKSRPHPPPDTAERIANIVVLTATVAALATLVAFGCVSPTQLAVHLLPTVLQATLAHVLPSMPAHFGQLAKNAVRAVLADSTDPTQIVLSVLQLVSACMRAPAEPPAARRGCALPARQGKPRAASRREGDGAMLGTPTSPGNAVRQERQPGGGPFETTTLGARSSRPPAM